MLRPHSSQPRSGERIDAVAAALRSTHETASSDPGGRVYAEDTALAKSVSQIVAGDAAALSTLYAETVARLYSLSRSILCCPRDAEEIVCDVFLFVWHNADRYDARRGSVMAWLAIITRNRSIDRRRRRSNTVSLEDWHTALSARTPTDDAECPEDYFSRFEANSRVSQVLARQSDLGRQLIALAFFKGLCHAEIVVVTGLPLGSVKSHIRRTLKTMRAMLAIAPSGGAVQTWFDAGVSLSGLGCNQNPVTGWTPAKSTMST